MKVLMYNKTNGMVFYARNLADAIRRENINIRLSDKMDFNKYDIYHIQFEHTVFPPFGLRIIPILILLRLRHKKIIIMTHTVLSRKGIYSRNNFFRFFKKIILPIVEFSIGKLANRIVVHNEECKDILINDYYVQPNKIAIIPHGTSGVGTY